MDLALAYEVVGIAISIVLLSYAVVLFPVVLIGITVFILTGKDEEQCPYDESIGGLEK